MAVSPQKLFTIAPGAAFLRTLVETLCDGGLVEGFRYDPGDPLCLARVTIYVATRRAARALRSEFVDFVGGGSAILPVIRPLGETEDDSGFFDAEDGATLDLLPPLARVDALLELASLIERWKNALPEAVSGFHKGSPLIAPASPADAVWLARGLADLLDAMETEACAWESLDALQAADYAQWWQLTLEFLKIATQFWPARLTELNRSSAAAHRNAVLGAEVARIEANTPRGPVIVAGSTGSVPATAALIAAIADLDQGAIVFPGLDCQMDEAVWPLVAGDTARAADPAMLTHPQYGLSLLLRKLAASRDAVRALGHLAPAIERRNALVSTALLPARATEAWVTRSLSEADTQEAFAGVALIEAGAEREEAASIAVAMRMAGENPAARVALVTPDRNLARRVAVELGRFGVTANDSAGVPLATTPPATLLRLLLDAVMQPGDPVALTGLVNHPLARFGMPLGRARRAAHVFELTALRGTIGDVDVAALSDLLDRGRQSDREDRHAPRWRKRLSETDHAMASELAEAVARIVAPLTGRFVRYASADGHERLTSRAPVSVWAEETARVLEAVAADEAGDLSALWGGEAGEILSGIFASVMGSRADLLADGGEWADIVAALLGGETVKPRVAAHPRLFIWGTLEARLQDIDTVVLAGLNEGNWPGQTANDPFLSRAMKMDVGLEPPERRIGLAAHDFQMAIGTKNVILSRSTRAGKAPTIASRWLQRLMVVVGDETVAAMRKRGDIFRARAETLDRRDPVPFAKRPEPKPALEFQPDRYSFSEVRTLRRDPYAIYARRVLKLDPLADLIRDPGVAERGTLYHAILEGFTRAAIDVEDPDALQQLTAIAEAAFAAQVLPSHIDVLWRPRFERIGTAFIAWETARNADIRARHTELRAKTIVPGTQVLLTGLADRIDMLADGTAEIIDYKSGSLPSRAQARALLDPQLPLEAAALVAGGFKALGPVTPSSLQYVRLKAGDILPVDRLEGKDRRNSDGADRSAVELGEEAMARLAGFVTLLAQGRRGFASRLVPASARDYGGEYDHLARVAEWATAEGDDDGGGDAA